MTLRRSFKKKSVGGLSRDWLGIRQDRILPLLNAAFKTLAFPSTGSPLYSPPFPLPECGGVVAPVASGLGLAEGKDPRQNRPSPCWGVSAGRYLGVPRTRRGGAPPRSRWAGPQEAPPPSAGEPSRSRPARSRLSVSVAPLPPGTVELGPPFAWEFCGRLGSAVTSQRAGPAATMVAKDYPFYLTVKRANCSLEVAPASSPVKDAEVGSPPGPLRSICQSLCLSPSPTPLTPSLSIALCLHLSFSVFLFFSLSPSASPIPSLCPHISHSLSASIFAPFCPFSVDHHEPPPLSLSLFLLAREQLTSLPLPFLHPAGLSDCESSV